MRLLLDEHLSPRLVRRLQDLFPESEHVQTLGLRGRTDRALWVHARDTGLVIASRDSDFEALAMTLGSPPKVILIRTKEGRTEVIESMFRFNADAIRRFESSADRSVLVLEHELRT
jgi:predicted nuclease of predicted toxin-antitoxin system